MKITKAMMMTGVTTQTLITINPPSQSKPKPDIPVKEQPVAEVETPKLGSESRIDGYPNGLYYQTK